MRILVTKQGNIIIQDLESLPVYTNYNQTTMPRGLSVSSLKQNDSRRFNYTSPNKSRNHLLPLSYSRKLKLKKFKNVEDIEFSKEELKEAKQIKLTNHKITFPKNFAEKYEKDTLNLNIINSNITSKEQDFELNSFALRDKYLSFKDIIPLPTVNTMKLKILSDKRDKEKNYRFTEDNFRSKYIPETDIQKFNKVLSTSKLNANKSSLIKYLHEKKVDPLIIKNLSNSNNDKIGKMNKMCQIYFKNEEKNKLFIDLVKNKIKQKINGTKNEFQNEINTLGKDISTIKERLNKYDRVIDEREKYREHFNDIVVKYWMKKDYERLNKKSTPKPKYLHDFLDD